MLAALVPGGRVTPLLEQALSVSGVVRASAADAEVGDLRFAFGESEGEGRVTAAFAETPALNVALSVPDVDFDPIIARLADDAWAVAEAEESEQDSDQETPPVSAAFSLPEDIFVHLDVHLENALLNGATTRDVRLVAALEDGVLTLQQLSARLPGEADFSLIGFLDSAEGLPHFSGQADFSTADARSFAGWLGVDVAPLPQDVLRVLSLSAEIDATLANVSLSRIEALADSSRLTGDVGLQTGERVKLDVDAAIDQIDADSYMPAGDGAPEARTESDEPPALEALTLADADVKLDIGTMVFRQTSISNLALDASLVEGVLTIESLKVADLAGLQATIDGHIDPVRRSGALSYDLAADDLAGAFRLADIDPPVPIQSLRPFQARGRIVGDVSAVNVDGSVSVGGVDSAIKGSLSGLDSDPALDVRIESKTEDDVGVGSALGSPRQDSGDRLGRSRVAGRDGIRDSRFGGVQGRSFFERPGCVHRRNLGRIASQAVARRRP